MVGGINFNANNKGHFINNRLQPEKNALQPAILQNIQLSAVKNVNEFIEQSAKNMYQFFDNLKSIRMQNSELSIILKDLFGMQKDLDTFLASITNQVKQEILTKSDLAKILINSSIDTDKLKNILQQNGKEALSKLFNITANYSQTEAAARSSQVNEIISILNACTPNSDTSSAQVLKNMMLLYLPWLPINGQNFTLEISQSHSGEDDGKTCEDFVTILISTVNFGNVQVLIFKTEKSSICFNIKASSVFPKEDIIKQLQAETQQYNILSEINYEKQEHLSNKTSSSQPKTNVLVNTGKHINPFLILTAQITIKVIIEFDKNASLIENRKEKL